MSPAIIGLADGPRRIPLAKRTPVHQQAERRVIDMADLSFLDAASFTNMPLEPLVVKENESPAIEMMPSDISEAEISMIMPPAQEPMAEGALREQERVLDASKREIFALKLKVYHLEERLKAQGGTALPALSSQREEELIAARDAALATLEAERRRFAAEHQELLAREEAQRAEAAQALREAEHRRFLLEAELEDSISSRQALASLSSEHESLRQEHASLLSKHAAVCDEHSVLVQTHTKLSEEHKRLTEEHSKLFAQYKKLLEEGERLKPAFEQLSKEFQKLQNEHAALQNDYAFLQQQLKLQDSEHNESTRENLSLQKNNEALKLQFQKEKESLYSQLMELQSEYGKLQMRCEELQTLVSKLEMERSQLRHQLDAEFPSERSKLLKEIETQRLKMESEIELEREKRLALERALAESKAILIANEEASIAERERLSKGLSAGRAALTASFEEERERIMKEAERRCAAVERQLAEATRALGESARALADRERWREEASQAARSAEARAAALAADLQRLQTERIQAGTESLQRSYDTLKQNYESLQRSSQTLQNNLESMRRSYEALERSHDTIQRRLQELQCSYETISQENTALSRRLAEAESEKARIQSGFSNQLSRSMEKTRDCELELIRQRSTIEELERQLAKEREQFQTELTTLRGTTEPGKDLVAAIADGLADRLRLTASKDGCNMEDALAMERQMTVQAEARIRDLSLTIDKLRGKIERRNTLLRKAIARIESLGRKRDALRQQLAKNRGSIHSRSFVALAQRALHRRSRPAE